MTLTQEQMNEMAKKYRKESGDHSQESRDSFDRCDTDGFLSQWAHDMNAKLDSAKADILENGGMAEFTGLYDGDRLVNAWIIRPKNQPDYTNRTCWMLSDEETEKFGRKFIPTGERSRIQKGLGLHEDGIMKPAWAVIAGNGETGLAGCTSCYIKVYERNWELTENSK